MSIFDKITRDFSDLPYMKQPHAETLRRLIHEEKARDLLEIGFYHGKSSLYLGAILEDQGAGRLLTLDLKSARSRDPNIETLLKRTGLTHRVEPRYCHRSYTWELQKLINSSPRPQFDLCYFDGGHTWDNTGFGVFLVDMLLRPGGILLLDDMDWSMTKSKFHRENPKHANAYCEDEKQAHPVRLVWETLLPHLGYEHYREYKALGWGVARKVSRSRPHAFWRMLKSSMLSSGDRQ